jgi:acetylornithine deacetylase/succinyl-diaminopimelate desuccinylase-like protein
MLFGNLLMDNFLLGRLLEFAIAIQQIPAPTFEETERAEFIREQFLAEGLFNVSMDSMGNVYGRQPGTGLAKPLVISAHTDTVFPRSTDLKITHEADKIFGPGIGDNSTGVAGLFGLLWALRQRAVALPGDLWLVANVCEEGLGNLQGMRAVVDRFKDRVLAYIILEGMSLGQIYHRGLDVQRYRITVKTAGGHSWVDYGRPSAVHELAQLINRLTALPLPAQPRTTLNVGMISGGTSVNSIASDASLELDLRSESALALATLASQVEALAAASSRPGVKVTAKISGQRPAGEIPGSHPLVRHAVRCLEAQGLSASLNVGSTDANIPLSQGLPAVCLGLTTGFGAHTTGEYINIPPLVKGLAALVSFTEQIWQALS